MSWSSSGEFLAIGSYDGKLRILNNVTWKNVTTLTHKKVYQKDDVVRNFIFLLIYEMVHVDSSPISSDPRYI
jgi:hypothetical protein